MPHPSRPHPITCLAVCAFGLQDPAPTPVAAPASVPQTTTEEQEPTHIGPHLVTLHGMDGPVACAFGPDGSLFVAEHTGNRVRQFHSDFAEVGTFGEGVLLAPTGIAVDADGRIFVSDGRGTGIHRLSTTGSDEPVLFGAAELHRPHGLAIQGERLAVADAGAARIVLFDLDGAFLEHLGSTELQRPRDVAILPDGSFAVLDGESIVLLSGSGELLQRFGAWGAFPGLLSSPGGIAQHAGRLFVCDTENHRVQVFDETGDLQYAWGVHAIRPREGKGKLHYPAHVALNAPGDAAALAEPLDGRVQVFRRAPGAEPEIDPLRALGGKPSAHYGLDWELSGNHMAAVEPESRRVLVYDLRLLPTDNPVQITEFGGYGTNLGMFLRPTGLWFDGPGRHMLVCDGDLGTLTEVRLDLPPDAELAWDPFLPRVVRGIDLRALEGESLPRPYPITPRDVALHPDGRLFVLCERNAEVLVLGPDLQPIAVLDAAPERFVSPVQLCLDPKSNRLLVMDELAGVLHSLDTRADRIGESIERIDGNGSFQRPFGVTLGPGGSLYVSDAASSQIHIRSSSGDWTAFGSPGIRHMEFLGPRALGFDGSDRLYVLDHGNHRGMVLEPDGTFLFAFGPRLYTKPARLPHTYRAEDYNE